MGKNTYERDAYFTSVETARECLKIALEELPDLKSLKWVEPSAGSGNFIRAAESFGITDIEAYDIKPMGDGIKTADWLKKSFDLSGYFVFGNPPYGSRNKLAIDFINNSFARGADYVGFLLMGSMNFYGYLSKIKGGKLVFTAPMNSSFLDESGNASYLNKDIDRGAIAFSFLIFKRGEEISAPQKRVFKVDINKANAVLHNSKFYSNFDKDDYFITDDGSLRTGKNYKVIPILHNEDEEFLGELVRATVKLTMSSSPSVSTINFWLDNLDLFRYHIKKVKDIEKAQNSINN